MSAPRVTVLMAVHNGAAHVRSAVDSVLAQTYADFELLVIDDASTDGSGDVVRAVGDARIRVAPNGANLGLTKSLNTGLALARGELVARHDADDLSRPERLATQVAVLDTHPEVSLVGSWYRKIDPAGKSLGDRALPVDHGRLSWALLFHCPFVHSAVVFRRRDVAEIGGYDERFVYAQDYDLWSRVARRGKVANVPATLVEYRQGPATMTSTVGAGSDEVLDIARRNIADVGGAIPTAADHRAMGALIMGDAARLEPNDIGPTLDRVLALFDHFCTSTVLTGDEVGAIRGEIALAAGRVTIAHAGRLTDTGYRAVRSRLHEAAPESAVLLPASRRLAVVGRVARDLLRAPSTRSSRS
jgi:hypothetical protein